MRKYDVINKTGSIHNVSHATMPPSTEVHTELQMKDANKTSTTNRCVVVVDELSVAVEQRPVGGVASHEARGRPEHVEQAPVAVHMHGVPLGEHGAPVDGPAELVRRALVNAVQHHATHTRRPDTDTRSSQHRLGSISLNSQVRVERNLDVQRLLEC